jgi:hypothetical protein
MKKVLFVLIGLVALTGLVMAAGIADRSSVTLSTTAGTATWTNDVAYSALDLKRVSVKGNLSASATVTVSRVTSDGVWTQTVGTVVAATGEGTQATLAYNYLKYGDKLTFLNSGTTGAVMLVEYEVQK